DAHRSALLSCLSLTEADPRHWRGRGKKKRGEAGAGRLAFSPPTVAGGPGGILPHPRELGAGCPLAPPPTALPNSFQTFVNLNETSRIELDANCLQSDARGIGSASGGNQDVAAIKVPLALGRPYAKAHAPSGPPLNLKELGR